MPGILALEPIASGLLAETVRWFTDVAALPLPERRYIASGHPDLVAWDCPQLVVSCRGVAPGLIEAATPYPAIPGTQGGLQLRHATFSIQLVRCVETMQEDGSAMPADYLDAAGRQGLLDCGALSQMTVDICAEPRAHGRDAWMPVGGQLRAGTVNQIGPAGNLVGYEALFQVTTHKVV